MRALIRILALTIASLTVAALPLETQARPYGQGGGYSHHHGHGGWHGGRFWGGVGLGIGVGIGTYYALSPWGWYAPYYPAYPAVVVAPPPPSYEVAPAPMAKAPPEPIIYPKRGQSPGQTEADRQDCNRWAMTQPSAVADASVFHRATLACMEGRGYTVK